MSAASTSRRAAHQDGIQALGGERITFRNLEINCNSGANAQLFLNAANGGMPTDIVCERCFLGSGAGTTLRISSSVRSGARNSTLCPAASGTSMPVNSTEPVDIGNLVLPADRCTLLIRENSSHNAYPALGRPEAR